jgi:hypothetical protein
MLPEGWLKDYVTCHDGYSRAPLALLCFSMLSVFGALFGRRVRVMRGAEHPIDTTQNVVLVAPSGEGKGTSINRAIRTVELAVPHFNIIGGLATMQGILSRLNPEKARGLIIAEELGALFGKQHFRANMDQEMTDLLDNKEVYRWHTAGTQKQDHGGTFNSVGMTFLAGTTLPWMQRCMPGTALEEGFASRVLWVMCVEPPRYVPHLPRMVPGYKEVVERLRKFYQRVPEGTLLSLEVNSPVGEWWSRWNETHMDALPQGDPWQRGWWNRKPSTLLQMGLVLSLAEIEKNGGDLELRVTALDGARRILEWAEPGMIRLLGLLGTSEPYGLQRKVLGKLADIGGQATGLEIHRLVAHWSGYRLVTDNTLKELIEVEAIKKAVVKTMNGRRSFGWKITDKGKILLQ